MFSSWGDVISWADRWDDTIAQFQSHTLAKFSWDISRKTLNWFVCTTIHLAFWLEAKIIHCILFIYTATKLCIHYSNYCNVSASSYGLALDTEVLKCDLQWEWRLLGAALHLGGDTKSWVLIVGVTARWEKQQHNSNNIYIPSDKTVLEWSIWSIIVRQVTSLLPRLFNIRAVCCSCCYVTPVTSYQHHATPRRLPAAGRGAAEAGRDEGGGRPQRVQQPRPQLLRQLWEQRSLWSQCRAVSQQDWSNCPPGHQPPR